MTTIYRKRGMRGFGGLGVAPQQCLSGQSWFCAKNTDCSSDWQWAANPGCWSMTPGEWAQYAQATSVSVPTPPVPTQGQLDAVASGAMTGDQLTQQLSNQQMVAVQQSSAATVQPDTSVIAQAANAIAAVQGSGSASPCASTMIPLVCDSTIYWALGIGAAVLLLLVTRR